MSTAVQMRDVRVTVSSPLSGDEVTAREDRTPRFTALSKNAGGDRRRLILAGDEVRAVWPGGAAWVRVAWAADRAYPDGLGLGLLCGVTTQGRWIWLRHEPAEGVHVTDHRPERNEPLRLAWVERFRSVRVRWDGEGRRAA